MAYALINPSGVIVRETNDAPPPGATKAGWKWLPIEVSIVGTGPVRETVTTINTTKVTRVTTLRDYTPQELAERKTQQTDREIDLALGRLMFKMINGLFRAINDERASREVPLAPLTRAQFLAYMTDTRPDAETISADQFRSAVESLL